MFFITENWAVAKSYEVRLAKNPDSELNTDARGPLGQRKRKVPERYSPPPASGIPLKKIPVTASSNKPVPESQVDMFDILSDGNDGHCSF
jgi:hypothetical protein